MPPASLRSAALILACAAAPASAANFDIALSVSGATAAQTAIFQQAAAFWTDRITGYTPGATAYGYDIARIIPAVQIEIALGSFDGVGGLLGYGEPDLTLLADDGTRYAYSGAITLDRHDVAAKETLGTLETLARHEIAHALGFGTLWQQNGLYTAGSGAYTGAAALAQYRALIDPDADFVPVEIDMGEGSDDYHWAEDLGGLNAAWSLEALTGELSDGAEFFSNITIAAFADLGYTVSLLTGEEALPAAAPAAAAAAVPAPPAAALAGAGIAMILGLRRRRDGAARPRTA